MFSGAGRYAAPAACSLLLFTASHTGRQSHRRRLWGRRQFCGIWLWSRRRYGGVWWTVPSGVAGACYHNNHLHLTERRRSAQRSAIPVRHEKPPSGGLRGSSDDISEIRRLPNDRLDDVSRLKAAYVHRSVGKGRLVIGIDRQIIKLFLLETIFRLVKIAQELHSQRGTDVLKWF